MTLSCKRMRNDSEFPAIPLRLLQRDIALDGELLKDSRGRRQTSMVVAARELAEGERAGRQLDEVRDAVLEALPEYPEKQGVQAYLVPKVMSILGRNVDHKTVTAKCFELEVGMLAESGPGRQKGSLSWGKAVPKEELDVGKQM